MIDKETSGGTVNNTYYDALYPLRLGPYSPALNPIGLCFSALKCSTCHWKVVNKHLLVAMKDTAGVTNKRRDFLLQAYHALLPTVNVALVKQNYLHVERFLDLARAKEDMPVGK